MVKIDGQTDYNKIKTRNVINDVFIVLFDIKYVD